MKMPLVLLIGLLMVYGCVSDIQSIKDEIRIPFISDRGSTQKNRTTQHQGNDHSESLQLGTDKQGQRPGK